MDELITLFDRDNPCWTEELADIYGEDPFFLAQLREAGFLSCENGIYTLTEEGAKRFETVKSELFLDCEPGFAPSNPERSVLRTKLRLLLDGLHVQKWGIKDYLTAPELEYRPKLERNEIFSADGGLSWLYGQSEAFLKMKNHFPEIPFAKRNTNLNPPEMIAEWNGRNSPEPAFFAVDLLYLCRYDFMHYTDFKGHPNDKHGLINADRFAFVFSGRTEYDEIETIGHFHLWLHYLRRVLIPGYVDRDTLEQDSVNWLIFTSESERGRAETERRLSRYGSVLTAGVSPCEIWSLSLEALESVRNKREVIWELLPQTARPIVRTI